MLLAKSLYFDAGITKEDEKIVDINSFIKINFEDKAGVKP